MAKKKNRTKPSHQHLPKSGGGALNDPAIERLASEMSSLDGEELDEKFAADLLKAMRDNPEAFREASEAMDEWRRDFVAQHGREPGEEDLEALFDETDQDLLEDIAAEDGVDLGADADEPGEGEPQLSDYEPDVAEFLRTCGWCRQPIGPNQPVSAFGIKTAIPVDRGANAPKILELVVASANRIVKAAVTQKDSEALSEGWDLMVHTCSPKCGRACRKAMQADKRFGEMSMVN